MKSSAKIAAVALFLAIAGSGAAYAADAVCACCKDMKDKSCCDEMKKGETAAPAPAPHQH